VRESRHAQHRGVVVVGVDGSAGAHEALRWAAAEARLRQTRLRVVNAWTFGFPGAGGGGYGYPYIGGSVETLPDSGFNDLRHAAEQLLDQVIAEVGVDAQGVEIERQVLEGGAVDVLVNAVTDGDLLVVGSRGHGGFAGLLLGSVSQQCAHHAPCPVEIVRAAKPATRDRGANRAAKVGGHGREGRLGEQDG
jgi:nucleotide-binding universal stress UspA family protein